MDDISGLSYQSGFQHSSLPGDCVGLEGTVGGGKVEEVSPKPGGRAGMDGGCCVVVEGTMTSFGRVRVGNGGGVALAGTCWPFSTENRGGWTFPIFSQTQSCDCSLVSL
jgi:hypothetical protein